VIEIVKQQIQILFMLFLHPLLTQMILLVLIHRYLYLKLLPVSLPRPQPILIINLLPLLNILLSLYRRLSNILVLIWAIHLYCNFILFFIIFILFFDLVTFKAQCYPFMKTFIKILNFSNRRNPYHTLCFLIYHYS